MIALAPSGLTAEEEALRDEVRAFLVEELPHGTYLPELGINARADAEFSRRLAARGWVGMVVPREYGGPERTAVERFVVVEELLAAGAPIGAHWAADRQTAPTLMRFGTEDLKRELLPRIVRGEVFFCLGMSEPDSGSDLASVSTRATAVGGGWSLTGTKVWTSGAHYSDYAVVLCRTGSPGDGKHAGLSQLIVDLSSPGVTVRPIRLLNGAHHFNEVHLDEVFVPDRMVLGEVGSGWTQVTSELAYERSGPDRFLTTFPLLRLFLDRRVELAEHGTRRVGELVARYWTLRNMSLAVARLLDAGAVPAVEAAVIKDVGTVFESEVLEVVRDLVGDELDPAHDDLFARLLADATVTAPTFTLRGGTNEVLRGVVAKALLREVVSP